MIPEGSWSTELLRGGWTEDGRSLNYDKNVTRLFLKSSPGEFTGSWVQISEEDWMIHQVGIDNIQIYISIFNYASLLKEIFIMSL